MPRDHLSALPSAGPPWDIILASLDLASLKNLRLCNQRLAEACVHHRFIHFISYRTTDLGAQSLKSLATIAAHPLGRGIKNLTILATIYDTSPIEKIIEGENILERACEANNWTGKYRELGVEELSQLEEELAWLERQREQDEANEDAMSDVLTQVLQSLGGPVESIKLEAGVVSRRGEMEKAFPDWCAGWKSAARAYRTVMNALIRSGVIVSKLIIYQDTPRCAIPPWLITQTAVQARSQAKGGVRSGNLKDVQEFALSVGIQTEDVESYAVDNQDLISATTETLDLMPNLTALELQIFRALPGLPDTPTSHDIFSHIARNTHLSSLERCKLQGIKCTRENLMEFITHHPKIQHLELANVDLIGGQGEGRAEPAWDDVVTAIVETLPSLDELWLQDLYVRGRHANLYPARLCHRSYEDDQDYFIRNNAKNGDPEGKEDWKGDAFPRMGGWHVHTLRLHGEMLKGDGVIRFRPSPQGRQLGSVAFLDWLGTTKKLYQPYES